MRKTRNTLRNAFLALTAQRDRTVHIEWSGATKAGNDTQAQAFDAKFDVAGEDYAGSVTTDFGKPGANSTVEYASVNGHDYERE